jgi:hypothetical protein
MSRPNLSFNIIAANEGFGVRQLAAAVSPASLLAVISAQGSIPASKLAGKKAAASCRTPKLRPKQKNLPAFGVGSVLLSKHGRRLDFSSHPDGPQGMDFCCAFSTPGSENTFILKH